MDTTLVYFADDALSASDVLISIYKDLRTVITVHDGEPHNSKNRIQVLKRNIKIDRAFEKATNIVVHSDNTYRVFSNQHKKGQKTRKT